MRELTRSNDPVFLSYLSSELAAEGIESLRLDGFASSVLEPMNMTAQQRVMVAEEDYWQAWGVLAEAEEQVTVDTLLGGRVNVLQPKDGFRASIDTVLLAACVPVAQGDHILDVGTGNGSAALCVLAREPWAWVHGIDVQPDLIVLAERSAERSNLMERAAFHVGDITDPPAQIGRNLFDHVISNPPYLPNGSGRQPGNAAKTLATMESTADLGTWLAFKSDRLRDGGTLSIVHRAEREPEILEALGGAFGATRILDVVTVDDGRPVKRVIVQATKGAPGETVRRGSLVVHEETGEYTREAQAILRDAEHLPISGLETD